MRLIILCLLCLCTVAVANSKWMILLNENGNGSAHKKENVLLVVKKKELIVPIKGFDIVTFLQKSILHIPNDIIRDGLPWFNSKRDDWNNKKTRRHLGIDIYCNNIRIVSPADGFIEKTGKNNTAGKWLKINHGDGIKTVFVHLSKIFIKKKTKIKRGELIASINKPEGNAIETQLHFEIQVNGIKVDPIPLIEKTHKKNSIIFNILHTYQEIKEYFEKERDQEVKKVFKK